MKLFRVMTMAMLVCCLWYGRVVGQEGIRFMNQTEAGILSSDLDLFKRNFFIFQTFNGVRLNEFVGVGATVGLDVYPNIALLPVSVGWRGFLPGGDIAPYLGVDFGYGLTWLKKETDIRWYDGGLMVNPVIGIRIKSRGKDRFSLGVGYKRQAYSIYEGQRAWGIIPELPPPGSSLPPGLASFRKDTYIFQRMSIRLGLVF